MEKIPSYIDQSWHGYLQPLFDNPKMLLIRDKILIENKYYPNSTEIFNVFRMPIDKIKVVILGQDPYPNGEAIGYAFAVSSGTKIPGSLEVIRKEVINSKVERDTLYNIDSDKWRTLVGWRNQGVFLLNTALTVEWKNPDSHVGIWQWFTREVIRIISIYASPTIWLLWGSKAKAFQDSIARRFVIGNMKLFIEQFEPDKLHNYVLLANHPAAELYPDSKYKFTGCNHFNLCNEILKKKKQNIINW